MDIPGDTRDRVYVIFIDGNLSPEAAQHAYDAIRGGYTNIGFVDRKGKKKRRNANLKGISTKPKKDRDEFLPAVIAPITGQKAHVRHIDFRDNRSAGAQIKHQINTGLNGYLPDGTKVIVIPINVPKPD